MCDPVTALTAASAGVGLLGSVKGGFDAKNAADQKAAQDQQNQALAEAQAGDALQRGAALAGRLQMQAGQVQAKQRAGYGASGVDANVGSAAQVQASTAAMGELDAKTAQNNAAREAWGFKVHAAESGAQAGLDREAGNQALEGSLLGGLGQLAAGAGATYQAGSQPGGPWAKKVVKPT